MNNAIPTEESIVIGRQAAEVAGQALEDLGRAMIRQKALDVARQVEIYLACLDFSSLDDCRHDARLAAIAVSKLGRSGHTAVHDTNGVNVFHYNPAVVGSDLLRTRAHLPQFCDIIRRGLSQDADGYYDWPEADGQVHRKYMYCAPLFPRQIAPLGLVVAATISIDEFLQPSREISERIITLAERVDDYHRAELRRSEQLRAINRLSRKISSYLEADRLLSYVTEAIAAGFQVRCVRIFLRNEACGTLELAARSGELPCPDDADRHPVLSLAIAERVAASGKHYVSTEAALASAARPAGQPGDNGPVRMIVPLKLGRQVLGVLDLIARGEDAFHDVDLFAVWLLADQVATALENARLHRELREMAVVEERNRIAREIHDTLAQGFAGISMLTQSAEAALGDGDLEQAGAQMDRIRTLAKEKLSEARRSVQDLRPDVTVHEDLAGLIRSEVEQLARDATVRAHFDVIGEEPAVPQAIKLAMLRICQESLHNIRKHSNATEISVALTLNPNAIALVIEDDGVGFDLQSSAPEHFGLILMRERARLVGGSVVVNSQVDVGTKVYVNMPL